MPSTVEQLREEIIDNRISLSTALRRAKVLAVKLNILELEKWIDAELDGYNDQDELPDYRSITTRSVGNFSGSFGRFLQAHPIPPAILPAGLIREFAEKTNLTSGIRSLESLLEGDNNSSLRISWPANFIPVVSRSIERNFVCIDAWKCVGKNQIEQIIDSVRNRLLGFVLELERKYPEIAESDKAISNIPQAQAATIVNNYIFGGKPVVAIQQPLSTPPTVNTHNYHAPVGAVQTGNNSAASVRQEVGNKESGTLSLKRFVGNIFSTCINAIKGFFTKVIVNIWSP